MKRLVLILVMVGVLFLSLTSFSEAGKFYVSNEKQFQKALKTAATNREDDIIFVAPGTYKLTQTLEYIDKRRKGSLTIQAKDMSDPPVLDGQHNIRIMYIDTTQIVNGTDTGKIITIKGVVFKNGIADGENGGGVLIKSKNATINIDNCSFIDNEAQLGGGVYISTATDSGVIRISRSTFSGNVAHSGGGLYAQTFSQIDLEETVFFQNIVGGDGGGFYATSTSGKLTISNSRFERNIAGNTGGGFLVGSSGQIIILRSNFSDNIADNGAGSYAVASGKINISNSTFSGNIGNNGGGIYALSSSGQITISYNIFSKNSAQIGGGVYAEGSSGEIVITSNRFIDNVAATNGGGAYAKGERVILTNNVFNNNISYDGGGLYITASNKSNLINNTIYGNQARNYGGGIYFDPGAPNFIANIYNNIIYNNQAQSQSDPNDGDELYISNGTIYLYNNNFGPNCNYVTGQSEGCVIKTFYYSSANNFSADPLFVDVTNRDFHLSAGSPCINAGNNDAPDLPQTDIEGYPRIFNGVVDLGAYERR